MFKRTDKFQELNHLDHPEVSEEMVEIVLNNPEIVETQRDGRVRYWGRADPFGDGELWYIRVVTLRDGETVLTAFIDGRLTRQMRSHQN